MESAMQKTLDQADQIVNLLMQAKAYIDQAQLLIDPTAQDYEQMDKPELVTRAGFAGMCNNLSTSVDSTIRAVAMTRQVIIDNIVPMQGALTQRVQ